MLRDRLKMLACPVANMAPLKFYARCLWIVAQVIAAYLFSSHVSPFFYQRF